MNKKDRINRAIKQLAIDLNGEVSQFTDGKLHINPTDWLFGRRRYIDFKSVFKAVTIGSSAVIMADSSICEQLKKELGNIEPTKLFTIENLKKIDNIIKQLGEEIVDLHHYFLPEPTERKATPKVKIRVLNSEEIISAPELRRFKHAFGFVTSAPDVIGILAVENDKIIGAAGASMDSSEMWQIGIDIDKEYSGRGTGENLVKLIKQEIINKGALPYYGMISSNIPSLNTAIASGFFPVWTEIYSKTIVK